MFVGMTLQQVMCHNVCRTQELKSVPKRICGATRIPSMQIGMLSNPDRVASKGLWRNAYVVTALLTA